MNKIETPTQKITVLLTDLVLITLSYFIALFLRRPDLEVRNWDASLEVLPWILVVSLFFLAAYEMYSFHRKTIWDIYSNIFIVTTFIMFFTMSASFMFRAFALPRSVILLAYLLSIVLLISFKLILVNTSRKSNEGTVLFVTKEPTEELKYLYPSLNSMAVKTISPDASFDEVADALVSADCLMIGPDCPEDTKSKLIFYSMKNDKLVYVVPSLYDLLVSKSVITSLDDTMIVGVKPFGLSFDQLLVKRLFDIVLSLVMLIVLSPLFLLAAIAIKIEEPKGTIFYKQERAGRHNRPFMIYKFRSMVMNAEALTGPTLAEQNDNRITKTGKFLRATRIDELPQLINVLAGHMSIIGPRPEREFFIQQFTKSNKSYQYRNTVKPGITGYAQIMGKYTTDVENKLRFDLYYIRNYSFWMDLVILLRTINVVLDKTKAEGGATKPAKETKTIQM